jgi:hypothetical protein
MKDITASWESRIFGWIEQNRETDRGRNGAVTRLIPDIPLQLTISETHFR